MNIKNIFSIIINHTRFLQQDFLKKINPVYIKKIEQVLARNKELVELKNNTPLLEQKGQITSNKFYLKESSFYKNFFSEHRFKILLGLGISTATTLCLNYLHTSNESDIFQNGQKEDLSIIDPLPPLEVLHHPKNNLSNLIAGVFAAFSTIILTRKVIQYANNRRFKQTKKELNTNLVSSKKPISPKLEKKPSIQVALREEKPSSPVILTKEEPSNPATSFEIPTELKKETTSSQSEDELPRQAILAESKEEIPSESEEELPRQAILAESEEGVSSESEKETSSAAILPNEEPPKPATSFEIPSEPKKETTSSESEDELLRQTTPTESESEEETSSQTTPPLLPDLPDLPDYPVPPKNSLKEKKILEEMYSLIKTNLEINDEVSKQIKKECDEIQEIALEEKNSNSIDYCNLFISSKALSFFLEEKADLLFLTKLKNLLPNNFPEILSLNLQHLIFYKTAHLSNIQKYIESPERFYQEKVSVICDGTIESIDKDYSFQGERKLIDYMQENIYDAIFRPRGILDEKFKPIKVLEECLKHLGFKKLKADSIITSITQLQREGSSKKAYKLLKEAIKNKDFTSSSEECYDYLKKQLVFLHDVLGGDAEKAQCGFVLMSSDLQEDPHLDSEKVFNGFPKIDDLDNEIWNKLVSLNPRPLLSDKMQNLKKSWEEIFKDAERIITTSSEQKSTQLTIGH